MFKVKRRRSSKAASRGGGGGGGTGTGINDSSLRGGGENGSDGSSVQSSLLLKSCLRSGLAAATANAGNNSTTGNNSSNGAATPDASNKSNCSQLSGGGSSMNDGGTTQSGISGMTTTAGSANNDLQECSTGGGGSASAAGSNTSVTGGSGGGCTLSSYATSNNGGRSISSIGGRSRTRTVRFKHIQMREYERVLGDNPSCSSGAPVAIGWAHTKDRIMPLDEYEAARPERRSQPELVLTRQDREEILIEWGSTFHEIIDSIRANVNAKNQRRRTVNSIGRYDKWEEAMEAASRKLKQTLLMQKPVSKRAEDLQAQSERLQKLYGPHYTYSIHAVHHMEATSVTGGVNGQGGPDGGGPPHSVTTVSHGGGGSGNGGGSIRSVRTGGTPVVTEPSDSAGDELRSMGLGGEMMMMPGGGEHNNDNARNQGAGGHRHLHLNPIEFQEMEAGAPVQEVGFIDDDWGAASTLANDVVDGDHGDDNDNDEYEVLDEQYGDRYYDDFADLIYGVPPTIVLPVQQPHTNNEDYMQTQALSTTLDPAAAALHVIDEHRTIDLQSLSQQPVYVVNNSNMLPVVISEDGGAQYDPPDDIGPNHNHGFCGAQPPPHSNTLISKWE